MPNPRGTYCVLFDLLARQPAEDVPTISHSRPLRAAGSCGRGDGWSLRNEQEVIAARLLYDLMRAWQGRPEFCQ